MLARPAKGTGEVTNSITEVDRNVSETGEASANMLSSAQSLSGEANRRQTEMQKFRHAIRSGLGNRRKVDDPNYAGPERRTTEALQEGTRIRRAV